MNITQIDQFIPSVHYGDGVTNSVLYTQIMLKELGFKSNVYSEHVEKELSDIALHYSKYQDSENKLLIVHYAIYYNFETWLNKQKAKKVVIYHNITPPIFFPKGTVAYNMCKDSIEYLLKIKNFVIASIGVSKSNTTQLKELGFNNLSTIALFLNILKVKSYPWSQELFDNIVDNYNLLFVGKIVKNKAYHHLVEIAKEYKAINPNFKFYFIGGTSDEVYLDYIKKLIFHYNLTNNIIITGKVSNEELYAYYRGANVFISMSEYEGFGVPFIESFLFNLPVVAYNSSNIKDILNGGGILFNKKSFREIAATIELLRINKLFRYEILNRQTKALSLYEHSNILKNLHNFLKSLNINSNYKDINKQKEPIYQFEGPFDSSYSLAIVNYNSAKSFWHVYPNQVALYATEGPEDYTPNKEFLNKNTMALKMYQLSKKASGYEIVFRNLYPPRVSGMRGKINLLNSFGWEESALPIEYVNAFNKELTGITVMSEYVKRVLLLNGVKVPISVVGLGIDNMLNIKPQEVELKKIKYISSVPIKSKTTKAFKFIHISSGFKRKGIEILLQSYKKAFTKSDDVTLIIKTFPNPHNNINKLIKEFQKEKNAPEIILINRDLQPSQLVWLYQNSHTLVAPSYGEGFGLPIAEAFAYKLPVITTGFGGQLDFCNKDTASLIDFKYKKSKSHLNLFNSYWVEPDIEHLSKLLKSHFTSRDNKKVENAYKLIINNFKWENYQLKTKNFINKLKSKPIFDFSKRDIAWISSYNTKCGIATYSEFILSNIDKSRYNIKIFANKSNEILDKTKEKNIVRCWNNREDINNNELIEQILKYKPLHIVVNFNFGFFNTKNLAHLIDILYQNSIKITIIFHSTADVNTEHVKDSIKLIISSLKKASVLLVHNIEELNYLKKLNLTNINYLPHGIMDNTKLQQDLTTPYTYIASYGFLLPHKGIIELIEAFKKLLIKYPKLRLLLVNSLYPVLESKKYYHECLKKIDELDIKNKVEFHTSFLSNKESLTLLSKASIIVMPYRKTNESASGAIRYAISTLKPVICTPQSIFSDAEEIVFFTKGYSPNDISSSIENLLINPSFLNSKKEIQKRWIKNHNWKNIAKRVENCLDI